MSKKRKDDSIESYFLKSIQTELEKKWKEAEGKKGISKDARLKIELKKLPYHWTQAICKELGYLEEINKDEQIPHITHVLDRKNLLEKLLAELSRSSLFILKCLVAKGGWITFQSLSRQANTDESGDSWWWVDEPPASPLGQLRLKGLVFVGRAPIKNRFYKILVIPRELRRIIQQLLPEIYLFRDALEEKNKKERLWLPEDEENYLELIQEIENYFDLYIDETYMLQQEQVVLFMDALKKQKTPLEEIEQAWEDIQCFLHFTKRFSLEKISIEDFKAWDFSQFVLKFIPREYGEPALIYEEVRRILYNVAEFYRSLKAQKGINSNLEIDKAIACMLRNDGKISKILPPLPRGSEILLKVDSSRKKKYISFARSDLWSLIVLCLRYNENWQSVISDLERKDSVKKIMDAAQKKNYLIELQAKLKDSKIAPYALLCYLKPDIREIDRAIKWFYNKKAT